ncbi:MAG TPA: YkgJ family cysteine cluster protein [Candidatus Angelobacter sp.]|nr:YkgJ family cysteine cluster protein [Candidatus Angelobacter sp.]
MSVFPPARDAKLVQIMDTALAEAARKSGEWLACRQGCTQCCVGPFAINQLDAARLRQGMAALEKTDSRRGASIRQRAKKSVARLRQLGFPGDPATGILPDNRDAENSEAEKQFEEFTARADNEPCPALDPKTGACDLYAFRPMTCRVFGPPVRSEGGLGVCELCFHGATDEQIAACEMPVDPDGLEPRLVRELENTTGIRGETLVAFCVL